MRNWNCDGNARNRCTDGEIRVYPIGGGGNMLYCQNCFAYENKYNAYRVKTDKVDPENFKQVNWATAKVYRNANGELVD